MTAPARRRPEPARYRNPFKTCTGMLVLLVLGMMALLAWVDGQPGVLAAIVIVVAGGWSAVAARRQKRARALTQLQAIQSTEVARYHAMNPYEFERAVAFLCSRDGCSDVRVVGGAGDLGADVLAVTPQGWPMVIQCKRYGPTTKVGSGDLQRFGGTCWTVHGAMVAAVVTTSVFTRPAADYAMRSGIRCIDQAALAGWASRTGPPPWA